MDSLDTKETNITDFEVEPPRDSLTDDAYQVLTYFTSIYGSNVASDYRPEGKRLWQKCMDLCLVDVETVHDVHSNRLLEVKYGMVFRNNSKIEHDLQKFVEKMQRISRIIHPWSYLVKVTSTVELLEKRWSALLKDWTKQEHVDSEPLQNMQLASETRTAHINRILTIQKKESALYKSTNQEVLLEVLQQW